LLSESVLKWENHSFIKNTPFRRNGEAHISYGTIQSVLKTRVSVILFNMRTELPFERDTAYISGFSRVEYQVSAE
jgi:hypothetical protein